MREGNRIGRTIRAVARVLVAATVLVFAGLGVGAVVTTLGERPAEVAESEPAHNPFTRTSLAEPALAPQSVADISDARRTPTVVAAHRVLPSVVSLRTERTVQTQDVLGRFFSRGGRSRIEAGLGSGFAIDNEGTIVTNAHVVSGADRIEVVDAGGQRFEAQLVGSDELSDLAVLRIPPNRVPAAPLGTSSNLLIGEPAVALGNPSGNALRNTEATVTSGVVSGLGRDIQSGSGREVLYADMIQTDASINPGNSGGPLANADGEVIGVNSSILSRSGGSEGLGFAIPIDRALLVAAELLEFGRVRRPWVGVQILTYRQDPGSVFGRPLVDEVLEGTPAAEAGLRAGDEILALNGRVINHDLDWQVGLADAGVGATVDVSFRRGGQEMRTRLRLDEVPSGRAERVEVVRGLQLITVTPQVSQERDLAVEFGAFVVSVGDAARRGTGLREGDVILSINRNEVRSAEDAGELFEYFSRVRDGSVQLYIGRGTESGYLRTFRVR
ncbi:trypsin-like peptidase domain-containing protein [Candidatus Palauibacter sp.]|uniref:trypsin-like peptidase domain-containing protein n=1 Tax=Candidatus Palauibacter sp. TaxID=3101350 RepID=UPI003B026CF0